MKAEDIKVGKYYIAKVSNILTTVRVDSINEGYDSKARYHVTNMKTGRKTIFRSASKFRREISTKEGKQTADPTTVNTASEEIRSSIRSKAARKSVGDSTTESETTSKEDEKRADPTISLRKKSNTRPVVERCTIPTQSDPTNGYPESMKTLKDTPAHNAVRDTGTATTLPSKKEVSVPTSKGKGLADKLRSKLPSPTSIQSLNFSSVAGYKPTEEQEAILETAVQKGLKSLVIAAGAGTGKTSTLKMLEAVLPGRGQYTAFNRALVEESKTKFKKASCKTTHGLAFGEVGRRFAHRLKSSRIRSSQIAYTLGIHQLPIQVAGQDHPKVLAEGFLAGQVMMAVRRFCQSADREISGKHFRYIDGIDFPDNGKRTYANNEVVREYLLPFAVRVWEDQCSVQGSLPYNPDCYVKMWQLGEGSHKPYIGADYILLDEAQDTAPVMLDILQQQKHALVILVGDDCQQIYEWRGACNAMKAYPNAPRRLLSQSFRFGQTIADVANSILSNLNEKTDLVMKGLSSIPSRVTSVADPRCYLFRTNAGAVSRLLRGMEEGKKPFLIGGGKEVVDFVKGAKLLQNDQPTSHPELCCFSSWQEVCSYVEEDEGEDLRLLVKLVNEFKCDPILNALENMPDEESADEVVSTAHKSKGREWESVRLGGDFPAANRMSDPDVRLLYVAATRAQHRLDIQDCPAFSPSYDKDTGEERPGISIRYTIDMPTEKQLLEFQANQGRETPKTDNTEDATSTTTQETVNESRTEETVSPIASDSSQNGNPQPQIDFTFTKYAGIWRVRGAANMEGKIVTVKLRSGDTKQATLKSVVARFSDAWVYEI